MVTEWRIIMIWMMTDGFSDLVEMGYPSDPRDAGSVANVQMDNFWVVGNPVLNIYENEANGPW